MKPVSRLTISTCTGVLYRHSLASRATKKVSVLSKPRSAKTAPLPPAYAGLAVAYIVRSASKKQHSRDDELRRIRTTAEKAIELDPLLAEAHDALAMSFARDGQWAQSENSFRHAIEQERSHH